MAPDIRYVNVFVRDLERACRFFTEDLGLKALHADPSHGYASFLAGAVSLGLAQVKDDAPESAGFVGRHTGIGFGVPDLNAAYERLRARGVRFPMTPEKQPWGGFMATFLDPDDNVYYLDELPNA